MIEFKMPSLGADMEAGTLREWLVKEGDTVKRGDIIAEVETQKGIIEIEVFDEGTIEKLLIKEDEKVPVGTTMAVINAAGKSAGKETKAEPPAPAEFHPAKEKNTEEEKHIVPVSKERIKASPLARRIAEENHIDLSAIKGSGEAGVIHKEDVEKAIAEHGEMEVRREQAKPEYKEKEPAFAASPTQGIRMAVAAAMSKSNNEIPHYYLETSIDMANALAWLAEQNKQRPVQKRLLPAVLLIKAVAKSLVEVPDLNAVWENGLQLKNEINIGFVVSLRLGGIIVPGIQQADEKSIDEIMDALNDIIPRAKALKLRSSELSSSTFTITNLGEGGVEKVYGIIYPPQVGLAGFGNITEQPFAENGMLGIRPVLTATLAGDHRATDGSTGSRFLIALKKHLQYPEKL